MYQLDERNICTKNEGKNKSLSSNQQFLLPFLIQLVFCLFSYSNLITFSWFDDPFPQFALLVIFKLKISTATRISFSISFIRVMCCPSIQTHLQISSSSSYWLYYSVEGARNQLLKTFKLRHDSMYWWAWNRVMESKILAWDDYWMLLQSLLLVFLGGYQSPNLRWAWNWGRKVPKWNKWRFWHRVKNLNLR